MLNIKLATFISDLPITLTKHLSIQVRFWPIKAREVITISGGLRNLVLKRDNGYYVLYKDSQRLLAYIKELKEIPKEIRREIGLFSKAIPVVVLIPGKKEKRIRALRALHKIGLRRGYLRQYFMKNLDQALREKGYNVEIRSLVYELRSYERKGRIFRVGGTASFWPKGVETLAQVIDRLGYTEDYYMFVKSIRFMLYKDFLGFGEFVVDRWGRITVLHSKDHTILDYLFTLVLQEIINSYITYSAGYKQRIRKGKIITVYSIENFKGLYVEAISPGKIFFDIAKTLLNKAQKINDLIILPIELGNPRIVTRIIQQKTGYVAEVIATYNGLTILPAPGNPHVDAELVNSILELFSGLLKISE